MQRDDDALCFALALQRAIRKAQRGSWGFGAGLTFSSSLGIALGVSFDGCMALKVLRNTLDLHQAQLSCRSTCLFGLAISRTRIGNKQVARHCLGYAERDGEFWLSVALGFGFGIRHWVLWRGNEA